MLRNRTFHMLLVTTALAMALSALGVSSAMATPKGEFAAFAQCPTSNLELSGCIVSSTESGYFKIGKQEVPIKNTQTLQGGLINTEPGFKELVAALNGETLTKTPQNVPGGLADLVNCEEIKGSGLLEGLLRTTCKGVFENGLTGVNATAELAAPAGSVVLSLPHALSGSGVALKLPIKVKLENPLLGSECYIGSNSNPVKLELTSGTSGSLEGSPGENSSKAEGEIQVVEHSTLVDGTFSAPGVTGCGGLLSFLLDPIINDKIGLPATSGNAAVLNNKIELAGIEFVRESEL
jgi:hypothetical protein